MTVDEKEDYLRREPAPEAKLILPVTKAEMTADFLTNLASTPPQSAGDYLPSLFGSRGLSSTLDAQGIPLAAISGISLAYLA